MLLNNNSQIFINSPLEQFEVTSLLSFNAPILGYSVLTLTNLALYSIFILFLVLAFHFMGNNDLKLLPSKWSIALESLFASINAMVREQIGSANELYLPLIYSLFCFVLFANLIGIIPYNFTITTSGVVSLGMSFTILVAVTILGLYTHKLHFFSLFVPTGCPLALVPLLVCIELVSYLARAFSLGIRLFANMVAGHSLLAILSSMLFKLFASGIIVAIISILPFALFTALVALEVGVAIIQAFVFSLLTCSYLKDAIQLH